MKRKNKGILKTKQKKHLASIMFLLPGLIGIMVFYILPFFVIIGYSLIDNTISNNFVFLDNFKKLFANTAFQNAVKNTLTFSAAAILLAVVLSLGLALVLEKKIPGKSKLRSLFLSPMMVPVASIVLIWQVLFDNNGLVNEFTSLLGSYKLDWMQSSYSQAVIILLFLWKNIGYNMVLFMAALSNIPKDLLEAAKIDGATLRIIFFKIKIPFISSTILFVTILSLINSFKIFREVYLLTGDYPYGDLYLLQHFMNNMFKNLDYPSISAAAIVMTLFMILVIGVLFIAEKHFGKDIEG